MRTDNIENDEYFMIPNPIYDVVFKYLMEDYESARIVLSTLIGEEIISLDFEPLSHTQKLEDRGNNREVTLFHLDFKAKVRLPNGETELILIELQKAKLPNDIFRFKRYIAKNFQQKEKEEIVDPVTKALKKIDKPIRLIPIFILNFRIENEIKDLLIKTSRTNVGVFKEKTLKKSNEFIDHLTYDIWVIQLPNLSLVNPKDFEEDEYKTKLYYLLKLFDQQAQMENRHRLLLIRKLFPGYLERIIKRLKSAAAENIGLDEQMIVEDEYLKVLEDHANERSFYKQQLAKRAEEAKQAIAEKYEAIAEKDETIAEKDKAIAKKDEIIAKEAAATKKIKIELATLLKKIGTSVEEIQEKTDLTIEEIKRL